MAITDSKAQTQSTASPIPTLDQIKRLKSLQGVDSGIFTLAVFSTLEAFFREKLGNSVDNSTKFYELLDEYRERYSVHNPREYQLFRDIQNNQKNTNQVRHHFKNLSVEEANSAAFLLSQFAIIFNLPNLSQINLLAANLKIWDSRKSPAETAKELEKANQELKRLSLSNADMAQKVEELESKKKELELVSTKLRTLQLEYKQQITKNKQNKERIDELCHQKNDAEQANRKTQKELQSKIEKLTDAENYIDNLSRMTSYTRTRYDYEQSLVHLTRQQEAIVNQVKFSRDFLIKGSAVTGKSLVLLKTLEKLIQQNKQSLFDGEKSIKLITFTHSLEKYNKYVAALLNIENPLEEEIIGTSDSYVNKILKDAFPNIKLTYDLPKIKNIEKENPLGQDIWTELDKFILPKCVNQKEYCEEKIRRTGMKTAQNAGKRKTIWETVEAIFNEWERVEEQPVQYVIYKLIQKIENGEYTIPEKLKTDYLFVDEAQDLSAATLRLIRSTVRESMILAGENDQSVFQPGFTWNRAGIDISGHSKILNINFRSTNQINEVAEKYRATIKGADKENMPETFRLGPPVELHENKNQNDSFAQMISTVRMCINSLNYEPENICLITQRKSHLEQLKENLKNQLDLDSAFVSEPNFVFSKPGIIRLATTQSCKGLDFPVVLFYLDHRAHFVDVFDEATADKMNRNMIYTAITRSIEMLHVFTPEDSKADAINDLKTILKTETK
ncbi:MAG: AAA family ATPase [Treponema sp.]|uniref:3'-5' exonuclease n=1 Tax=Treponema sp. TaxID=166 RepID=UPI002A91F866|nr:3'-5' exonuclease [Treponema sp.]MDY6397274.1 AAA family ATPase [Treponema sp.]